MDEPAKHDEVAELLAALASGSDRAFAALFDRFAARLFRTALGILGRRSDAEDATQEVFLALVRSRARLASVEDLPAYLFASLRRAAIRLAERRGRQQALPQGLDVAGPEPREEDPRADALAHAVAALPFEQREVLAMKIDGELTFAEIGRALAISSNTAASRYRYALERLRERMQE